jgi:hypothetical protein
MKRLMSLFLLAQLLYAEPDPLLLYRPKLAGVKTLSEAEATGLLDLAGNYRAFAWYLLSRDTGGNIAGKMLELNYGRLIQAFEQARLDKQIGGAYLVSKAAVPALLGVAVEAGALTQTRAADTVTFRGNADGVVRFLFGQSVFTYNQSDPSFLRNAGFSISLDQDSHFSGFGVRYAISDPRDVRSDSLKQKWLDRATNDAAGSLRQPSAKLLQTIAAAYEAVETNPRYAQWLEAAAGRLAAAPPESIPSEFQAQLDLLAQLALSLDPAIDDKLAAMLGAYDAYLADRREFYRDVTERPVLTLEYAQTRSHVHTARLIYETNPFHGSSTFTANAGLTVAGRDRHFDLTAAIDRPLGSSTVLTAGAGYLDGVFSGQALVTFRVTGSGVRVPIGFVWSNRPGAAFHARFGITLDMDTLFMSPK